MVSRNEVLRMAKLARLLIDENEIEQLTEDMSELINFASTIDNVVQEDDIKSNNIYNINNAFHEDEVVESYMREEVLRNREGGENGYFVVRGDSN